VAWVENHSVATTPPTNRAITATTNVALEAEPCLRSTCGFVAASARGDRCARRA
jgi:hypothetical protein